MATQNYVTLAMLYGEEQCGKKGQAQSAKGRLQDRDGCFSGGRAHEDLIALVRSSKRWAVRHFRIWRGEVLPIDHGKGSI